MTVEKTNKLSGFTTNGIDVKSPRDIGRDTNTKFSTSFTGEPLRIKGEEVRKVMRLEWDGNHRATSGREIFVLYNVQNACCG